MVDTKPAARAADEGRKKARSSSPEAEDIGKVTVLDVLRVLGGLLLLNFALSWYITGESVLWGWRPWFSRVDGVRVWMVSLVSLLFPLFEGESSRGDIIGASRPVSGCLQCGVRELDRGRMVPMLTWEMQRGPVLLTDDQLSAYDGSDPSKPIYLALNGTIYDVSAGRHL